MKKQIFKIEKKGLIALITFFFLFYYHHLCCADIQHSFRAKVILIVDLTKSADQKEARLWLPYPVSDRYQKILSLSIKGTYKHHGVYTDRRFVRPIFYAFWPKDKKEKRLIMSFIVERDERKENKTLSSSPLNCLDRAYFKKFLMGSNLSPLNQRVVNLAKHIVGTEKDTFKRARLIYNWVIENMRRNPDVKGCGCGNVCILLDSLSGKCADIHSVFVALLKAAGVPAREVFGLRLSKKSGVDLTKWQHCWAEFYVPGYGWYVADPGDYLKALLEKRLNPTSKIAVKLSKYYFGAVDPYRVRLGIGRDIELNPPSSAGKINYLMYPYAEVDGKALNYLEPESFSYTISQEE